jgi:F420-dependent oxidoreductase-like protein
MDHAVKPNHALEMKGRVPMRFALMIEPQQGLSYDEQLSIARRTEAAGFEALFRSDHYQSFPGAAGLPTTDAWAVLAGLARDTAHIGLGVLVTPVTFRTAGNLAKVVTTVDEMSGGRVELGLGAGWNETEHRQLGLPFPPIGERADRLEETLDVIRGLWEEPDGWSFHGRHVTIEDACFHPKPVRRAGRARPRLIVGSTGTPRSYRIAARLADEFNVSSQGPQAIVGIQGGLDEACRAIGREPASLARSAMVGALVGRDQAEVARRQHDLLEAFAIGDGADAWFAERRTRWIIGTPDEARTMVRRFADAGVERIMLQDFVPRDLEMIDLLGAELVGRV